MVNGVINFGAATGDFPLQRRDPGLELGHRMTIEILAHERCEGIVGPGPKDIIQIHDAHR